MTLWWWVDRSLGDLENVPKRAVGRALLVAQSHELIGGDPEVVDTGDRPRLASDAFDFSISHSGPLTMCALSSSAVGVDLELLGHPRTERLAQGLPDQFFTASERAIITAEREMLPWIFTRKEALAKYLGVGIGVGLSKLDSLRTPAGATLTTIEIDGAVASLCHEGTVGVEPIRVDLTAAQLALGERLARKRVLA